jgi:tetratricopeptide (TPR) repeat protein
MHVRPPRASIVASTAAVLAVIPPFIQQLGAAKWIVSSALGIAAVSVALRELVTHAPEGGAIAVEPGVGAEESSSGEGSTPVGVADLTRAPLAQVRGLDPFDDLGVSFSSIADELSAEPTAPYVRRQIDDAVIDALSDRPFVLIVGPTKAGKSRTAYEAVRRALPNHMVVVPKRPREDSGALRALFGPDSPLRDRKEPLVLWLDDLHDYLRADAIDRELLQALRERDPPVTTVATIRESEIHSIVSSRAGTRHAGRDEVAAEQREVLARARTLRLEARLNSDELSEAAQRYPRLLLSEGLGVALVAGPELINRFRYGREACPEGVAVALAVADWTRAGAVRPILRSELRTLFVPYLRELRPRTAVSDSDFENGLSWAIAQIHPSISLAYPAADDGTAFSAFDFFVGYLDGEVAGASERIAVRPDGWSVTLQLVSPNEALSVGRAAVSRSRFSDALRAFEKAETVTDKERAAEAAFDRGHTLRELGQMSEAVAAFQKVRADGTQALRAQATYALGLQSADVEDFAAAEEWYRDVIDTWPGTTTAAKACVNLGLIVRAKGGRGQRHGSAISFPLAQRDVTPDATRHDDEADRLFRVAVASADAEAQSNGANALAVLLRQRGEYAAADEFYGRAVELGNRTAAVNRGDMLIELGELHRAEQSYLRAVRPGTAGLVPGSLLGMARLRRKQGRADEARDYYDAASACEETEYAYKGLVGRAELALSEGEISVSDEFYGAAVARGGQEYGAAANHEYAHALSRQGRVEEARSLLETIRSQDHPVFAAYASFKLAWLDEESGEKRSAADGYRRTLTNFPRTAASAKAAVNLGLLLRGTGGADDAESRSRELEAEQLFRYALELNDAEALENGTNGLAVLLEDNGRYDEAEAFYSVGVTKGYVWTALNYGRFLLENGRTSEAGELIATVEQLGLDQGARDCLADLTQRLKSAVGGERSDSEAT